MKEIFLTIESFANKNSRTDSIKGETRKWWIRALYFCSVVGFFAGFLGLLMSATAFIGFVKNTDAINRIGTWMIVTAFPIIILGAHAMDKIAEIDKTEHKQKIYSPE